MNHEQLRPDNAFSFTEREGLSYRVSDARFQALLEDERTAIHATMTTAIV
jgi:hypothetical protein